MIFSGIVQFKDTHPRDSKSPFPAHSVQWFGWLGRQPTHNPGVRFQNWSTNTCNRVRDGYRGRGGLWGGYRGRAGPRYGDGVGAGSRDGDRGGSAVSELEYQHPRLQFQNWSTSTLECSFRIGVPICVKHPGV